MLGDPGANLWRLGLPGERVSDKDELVSAEDDEFAVGDEDFGRLVVVDGGVECVDGVGERGDVGLALLHVKEQQLPVAHAQLAARRLWVVRGRSPARNVIVDWLRDLLFQSLKLLQLLGTQVSNSVLNR